MTYLAPRQGLFAIIILVSFLIHTTLLVISTDQQLNALKKQTSERMLEQLIEEVKLPLLSDDKVSLSVLMGRYTSEGNIVSIRIDDNNDQLLLQTGDAQLQGGDTLSQPVILDNDLIGEVTLTLRDISYGEIISSQWIFILGSFITHLFIWLLYGYVARPTRSQLAALSREAQDHVMSRQVEDEHNSLVTTTFVSKTAQQTSAETNQQTRKGRATAHSTRDRSSTRNSAKNSASTRNDNSNTADNNRYQSDSGSRSETDIHAHLRRQGAPEGTRTDSTETVIVPDSRVSEPVNDHTAKQRSMPEQQTEHVDGVTQIDIAPAPFTDKSAKPSVDRQALVSNRPMRTALIQIEFYDPLNLFNAVAPSQSKPYFNLCTQLLQRTLKELFKQPIIHGVSIQNEPEFTQKGANVVLHSHSDHYKVALAATMLAVVYDMLHNITSFKLNEMNGFHAPIHLGISDDEAWTKILPIMESHADESQILVLLPSSGLKQLSNQVQLKNLPKPKTVFERDCAVVDGISSAMMERLVTVRDNVLLSAQ